MSAGPREQTTEPLRDKIAQVLSENRPSGGTVNHPGDWEQWISETTAEVVEALGLTEEAAYRFTHIETGLSTIIESDSSDARVAQRIAGDTHTLEPVRRWVSGWSVVGGEPSE